ncbi:CaiB/BaiF CoA transferase family protein [Oceanibacterium hippocampi]|uniref:Formyl-coenzyme A transferase n=1 Tax=Oceanibacterium hippocampi TaxID=745714 RepID=A0A1Y5TWS5_9PROT|nr:CoA transferase [Oceanibacterium hippocampi]SLN75366.1 Formyl-coenzyme A transferase [Oceanibacterium hippocampi]
MTGTSANEPARGALPLAGIRVIAVEQYGAGPFGTLYLGDMGAEIIKIEPPATERSPGGDSARQAGAHFLGDNESQFFQAFNLGKKSMQLDIKSAEGRAIFHRLVGTADAVVNNLRGDLPDKLGLTHATLGDIKPGIICAHLSGYGRTGERANWPAYDYLLQAEAGFMALTGEPGQVPTRMGLSVVDYLTGITTAFAMTAALLGAARTGKGRDIDVTLYDVAMHQLTYPATWYLNAGEATGRRPRSGHPSAVPCELFPTRDGHIFIMCVQQKFWERLCAIIERPAWLDDPRFTTPRDRFDNRDLLVDHLDARLGEKTTAEWMALMQGHLPVAPVLDLAGALDNPYFQQQGGIQTIAHPLKADFRAVSNPIRVDGERLAARPAPMLGADTKGILNELGYGDAEIADLRARKII